jgi:hypothetical protein
MGSKYSLEGEEYPLTSDYETGYSKEDQSEQFGTI